MSGNRTSPKMAVHSSCSPDVSSGERRERWRDEKAWCLISRQGLVHCVVKARKMGDQYAAQASLLSRCDCCMRTGIRVVREKIMVMALTPLATAASTLGNILALWMVQRRMGTYCGWGCGLGCFGCCGPLRTRLSCFCSTVDPTLPAEAKSLSSFTADS